MSEFLVRDSVCTYWTDTITPEEFDNVIQIRYIDEYGRGLIREISK